jgi:hypothetical protein
MQLTGHQTEAAYRRYAILVERDLVEGVGKLAALPAAPAGARTVVALAGAGTSASSRI